MGVRQDLDELDGKNKKHTEVQKLRAEVQRYRSTLQKIEHAWRNGSLEDLDEAMHDAFVQR